MDSIIDYIKTYGSRPIDVLPFTEVDSLILCQLSYLKYDGLLPAITDNKPGMTLAQLTESTGLKTSATPR